MNRVFFGGLPASALFVGLTMVLSANQVVHAEASSQASLGPYAYTLTDLDPDDGIAPSITFGTGQVTQRLSAGLSVGRDGGGGPAFYTYEHGEPQTYVGGLDTPRSMAFEGFSVDASAYGLSTSASMTRGGAWGEFSTLTNTFELSPRTAVTFTSQGHASMRLVVPDWSVVKWSTGYMDNGYFDWAPLQATSLALMYIGTPNPSFGLMPDCRNGCVSLDYVGMHERSYASLDKQQDKLLSTTFTNDTDGRLGSTLMLQAQMDGYATAPLRMVPEASTWAQMMLGLLGLGVALARRGRR